MPQFYFHLTNGILVEDFGGETFELVAEARGHAVRVAEELGREDAAPCEVDRLPSWTTGASSYSKHP
jgi:hypothetical protein